MNQIAEARDALLKGESWHGATCSTLHYNLACYHSLMGDQEKAKIELSLAFRMDKTFRQLALGDKDLELLWSSLGLMT